MLMENRGTEQFYGQAPLGEYLEPATDEVPLPPLEDLVKRIPAPAREKLEELFRPRFVTVRRIPQSALKA